MKRGANLRKKVLLSFDVEEFDLPREHGVGITLEEGVKISSQGLSRIMRVLSKTGVKATFFVTGNFASENPEAVKKMVKGGHEVACHGVDHFMPQASDLARSREIVEKVAETPVFGYRAPRMQKIDYKELSKLGYLYDSSVNPTWIPGRYNNRKVPRRPYLTDDWVWEIPTSVATGMRVPLFWLTLHLFPVKVYVGFAKTSLRETGYFATYFHPWEFADLPKEGVPGYIRKNSGEVFAKRLLKVIEALKKDDVKFVGYGEMTKLMDEKKVKG